MTTDAASNLGRNLRQLRELRRLTQHQLATAAGVPRATVANLETGSANPTLGVLLAVAEGLGVTVQELIGPPRAGARLYRSDDLPQRQRGGVTVRKLLPDALPGVVLERLALPSGGRMIGVPHTAGTREYLVCEQGVVTLTAAGETTRLEPGDVLVFRGDQRHSYHNPEDSPAVAYSALILVSEVV